ncbi:MAG TPA: hypothetical protein DCO77_07445 [Nitrospiraceae bacterium]|nr:hypothetical protein [Nitrospiraceae bacterium]
MKKITMASKNMRLIRLLTIFASFLFSVLLVPHTILAADPLSDQPRWSTEVKGGLFYPDIDEWKTYYGKNNTYHLAGTIAFKLFRQLEVGIEGGYIRDKGQGFAPGHGNPAGSVIYELFPLQAFLVFRWVFSEEQWFVPYFGGGWTRMYYREKIEFQGDVKGSADGYHARAGLQFLLDDLDPDAANKFYSDYGVHHTYFFLEAQYISAVIGTPEIDLGGTSFLAGLLFEY